MVLLKLHFKQLKAIHKSCINNCSTDLSELEEQIRDAEYTLNCISMDCFKLSQLDTDPRLINNYFAESFTSEHLSEIPFKLSRNPCMSPVTVSIPGITKLRQNLNSNKAKGPDGISPYILKTGAIEIGPILAFIFNQSLSINVIPNDYSIRTIHLYCATGRYRYPTKSTRPASPVRKC